MAERTSHADTVTRDQVADELRAMAEAFESGDTRIQVGNKSVHLSPPDSVNFQVNVIERSSLLRGNQESLEIELDWNPE